MLWHCTWNPWQKGQLKPGSAGKRCEETIHCLHLAPSKSFPSCSSKKFLLEITNIHKKLHLEVGI